MFGSNVVELQSDVAVIDDVKAGRIDAGIVNNHANSWRLTQDQYKDLSLTTMQTTDKLPHTQQDALAVVLIKKGETDVRDAVNLSLRTTSNRVKCRSSSRNTDSTRSSFTPTNPTQLIAAEGGGI